MNKSNASPSTCETMQRQSRTPEYRVWCAMKTRCYNPNAGNYQFYGGRGIVVCDRWRESFLNFLDDMGKKPFPSASIDRYPDADGPYSPENCRWASKKQQSQNSRKARMITYEGETLCVLDWAKRLGITHSTLRVRLDNWTIEKALTAPATPSKQSMAQMLTHDGNTLSLKEWANKLGIPYSTLCYRLRNGWSIEKTLNRFRD